MTRPQGFEERALRGAAKPAQRRVLADPGVTPARGAAAAVIGNILEFYDFTVYAFFAVPIGRAFFPAGDSTASLLFSVGAFGVGFLTRPLGAAVLGAYADRAGRRAAMLVTIVLMAAGMLMLALTPSYATIGIAAPVIVVLARLLQGFSLGGDVGAASAFLIEAAHPARRGLLGSWQIGSQGVSTLIAGLVGVAVSATLPTDALDAWGWRIAMLVGLAIVPVGLVIRRAMPETLPADEHRQARTLRTLAIVFKQHTRTLVLSVLVCMPASISIYILNYMTTYAVATLHLPTEVAQVATIVNGAMTCAGALFGGWLSDRVGRKPVMVVPRLLVMVLALPAYILLNAEPNAWTLLLVTGLLTLLNAPSSAATAVIVPESFPQEVRGAGFAVAYALAVTLFGGTAQFVVTWLIRATADPLAPAGYMVVSSVIGVIAMVLMSETRKSGAVP